MARPQHGKALRTPSLSCALLRLRTVSSPTRVPLLLRGCRVRGGIKTQDEISRGVNLAPPCARNRAGQLFDCTQRSRSSEDCSVFAGRSSTLERSLRDQTIYDPLAGDGQENASRIVFEEKFGLTTDPFRWF
jgi:hypothetical protein